MDADNFLSFMAVPPANRSLIQGGGIIPHPPAWMPTQAERQNRSLNAIRIFIAGLQSVNQQTFRQKRRARCRTNSSAARPSFALSGISLLSLCVFAILAHRVL